MTPRSILLVDDDRDFLEMNRGVLEACGYRVRCAGDPRAALAAAETARPDLVVTDLMMDRLDAGLLPRARASRSATRGVPVILVTAVSVQRGFDFRPRGARRPRGHARGRLLRQAGGPRRR